MSRLEEVRKFLESRPQRIECSTPEDGLVRVEIEKMYILMDIDVSLAQLVDIFKRESVREDERDEREKREKESIEKTCENCMYDPNDKLDISMACGYCYDYNNWEGKEC